MSEFCYKQQKLNPTRFITRSIMSDRIIHTDWNCGCEAFYQRVTYRDTKADYTIAIFRIKK